MATSSVDEFRISRLSSENYHAWSVRVKAALVQKSCWEAIDPGFAADMSTEEKKLNNRALTFLFLVVEDTYLDDIEGCVTAKEAWQTLKEIHTRYGLLHILQLMRDFFNIKKKRDEEIKSYLGRLIEIHRKLSSCGYGFNDKEVALVMLMGLPESYESLILNLEQDEEGLTTQKVKARLLVEEKRISRREEERSIIEEDGKVLLTRNQQMSKSLANEKVSMQSKRNYFQRHENFSKRVKCYCCNKFGHIARNCPESRQKMNSEAKMQNENHSVMTVQRVLSVKSKQRSDAKVWYLDSGATDHMTPHREKFIEFKPLKTNVKVANKEEMNVEGIGQVNIRLYEENVNSYITLENVLYVPGLDSNLLSVGKIEERGRSVNFADGKAEVLEKNGTVLLTAQRKGRVYEVEEYTSVTSFVKTASDESLWHRRLGHLHYEAVRKLKPSVVHQLDESKCSTCIQGKLKRQSFPKEGGTRASKPLELVHSDVVGRIEPASMGGSSYFVTFIDDYSRYTAVYPMKHKSQVLEKFDEYRNFAENFHKTKIEVLRSDNGGEYKSKEFDHYMVKHGIQRQFTVPKTPQQNGVSERMNQTLLNMTRCLLIESGLPTTLWAEAVYAAAYIRNKCPTNALDGQIPENLWSRGKSSIDNLRVYGCRVWGYTGTRPQRLKKLDPKAVECVFIGYPKGVKGYKLWDRRKDIFFVCRDVVFEEGIFPCKLSAKEQFLKNDKLTKDELSFHIDGEDVFQGEFLNFSDQQDVNTEVSVLPIQGLPAPMVQVPSALATPMVRRSERIAGRQQTQHPDCHLCHIVKHNVEDPITIEEALAAPDAEYWKSAIDEEIENLKRNETWTIVPRPEGRPVVKCRWVFKKKYDETGNLERYKARLVAQGFTQVEGLDYKETFSPVVKTKSIRTLFALAVERNWEIHQLDITAAYLNGILKETIYMEQPLSNQGESNKRQDVCLLKKSIYGLHQSGREWNNCLDDFLKAIGLKRSVADPCIYFSENSDLVLGVYVDDILLLCESNEKLAWFKSKISQTFEVKDLGKVHNVLSMRVKRYKDGTLTLDQSSYADELLRKTGMDKAKGATTTLDPGMKYSQTTSDNALNSEESYRYRQAVGGLLYTYLEAQGQT